ncbi:MAG: hypothetical protein RXQ62_02525 [Nitrososphaeria archaeon]|jgi:acyl-CoA thioesterase FadM
MDGRFRATVSFDDTDCTGRVHFSRYAIWIDRAIQDFFRAAGFRFLGNGALLHESRGEVVAFAIGEYWTRMDRPLALGSQIEAVARPSEVRPRRVSFEGLVIDVSDGATVARGRITMVHIDPSTGGSREIPEWLRSILTGENINGRRGTSAPKWTSTSRTSMPC